MKQLFDKDFFSFTVGFLMIVVASMSLLALTGYYKTQLGNTGDGPVATPSGIVE